jgi:uncharacterized coiled-coil protein SlyX
MSESKNVPGRPDRLAELEFLFTHLERQVAEMNGVLLAQQRLIEQIEKDLRALREARRRDAEPPDEEIEF